MTWQSIAQQIPTGEDCTACGCELFLLSDEDGTLLAVECACSSSAVLA